MSVLFTIVTTSLIVLSRLLSLKLATPCHGLHSSCVFLGKSRREQFKTARSKARKSIYKQHMPLQDGNETNIVIEKTESEADMLHGLHPVYSGLTMRRRAFERLYMRTSTFKMLSEPLHDTTLPTSKENIPNIDLLKQIWNLANEAGLPIMPVNKSKLDKLCSYGIHQGLVGVCSALEVPEFSVQSLEKTDAEVPRLWLLIDNVVDPMNIGAILRSAVYFGVDKIVLSNNCSKLSPVVSKASAGAMEFAAIETVQNVFEALIAMRQKNWDIIGTSCNADKTSQLLKPAVSNKDTVVIIGSESRGVNSEILAQCTQICSVHPHVNCPEYIDSLNVSAASAIILSKLRS